MDEQRIMNVLKQMREWGRQKSPSATHQFAVLNVFSNEEEANADYQYTATETRWFSRVEHRAYSVHAEALLVGNPDRKVADLRIPYDESCLGELAQQHETGYLLKQTILIYSNHEPCKWCKVALNNARKHFAIPGNIMVGYGIPRSDSKDGPSQSASAHEEGVEYLQVE